MQYNILYYSLRANYNIPVLRIGLLACTYTCTYSLALVSIYIYITICVSDVYGGNKLLRSLKNSHDSRSRSNGIYLYNGRLYNMHTDDFLAPQIPIHRGTGWRINTNNAHCTAGRLGIGRIRQYYIIITIGAL